MNKKTLKEELFFSMTWDYLNIFLPSQPKDGESVYGRSYRFPPIFNR